MLPPQVHVRVVETGHAYGAFGKSLLANLRAGRFWAIYYRMVILLSHWLGKHTLCLLMPVFGLFQRYDCAIAYRPGPCADIVAHAVRAHRRICWWHNGKVDSSAAAICEVDATWRHFDKVVTVSHGCKQMLSEHFTYPAERIVVIPNMIDAERIRQLAGDTSPYPDDGRLHFVTVGRLCKEKRVDNALRAARQLIDDGFQPFCWHIVGDGELMEQLKTLASELNLGDSIDFLGNQPNPYPYIKFADLLVHTSHVESQSIVVLEAMSLGILCVVTHSMGPKEFLINGKNGCLVNKDIKSLVAEIKNQMTLPKEKSKILTHNAIATACLYAPKSLLQLIEDQLLKNKSF
jgi:glycosyltransferase involved in cell wall biosynthesis